MHPEGKDLDKYIRSTRKNEAYHSVLTSRAICSVSVEFWKWKSTSNKKLPRHQLSRVWTHQGVYSHSVSTPKVSKVLSACFEWSIVFISIHAFRNKKFFNFNRCCRNAERYCHRPCAGQECAANCRVQCGFLGSLCPAVSCSLANPGQCTGSGVTTSTTAAPITSSCDPGYTLSGDMRYNMSIVLDNDYCRLQMLPRGLQLC